MSNGEDAQIYDFQEYKRNRDAQKKRIRKQRKHRNSEKDNKAAHPASASAEKSKMLEDTLKEKHSNADLLAQGYRPYVPRKSHLNKEQFTGSYNPDNISIPWTFVEGLGGDQTTPGGIQRPDEES